MSTTPTHHRAADLLRALANAHRLAVLDHLAAGERSVGELERLVGIGQSALSQHLARLRRARMVQTRRGGRWIVYALDRREAAAAVADLNRLFSRRRG